MAHAILILAFVLTCASAWTSAQGGRITATTPKRGGNAAAAKVANPVPATVASIAAGRKTYMLLCSRCHGPAGKGDGGGAGAGGQPADFTDEVWEFGSSDGEIFAAIAEGTSADMESYAERIAAPEIWNLVNYLRSLKPRPRRL
ncbi:MAG: c-type cytochrome [Acidobacteriota bacterium]|nr:c-type cytochrome [Acidobacteriota bacterium]